MDYTGAAYTVADFKEGKLHEFRVNNFVLEAYLELKKEKAE